MWHTTSHLQGPAPSRPSPGSGLLRVSPQVAVQRRGAAAVDSDDDEVQRQIRPVQQLRGRRGRRGKVMILSTFDWNMSMDSMDSMTVDGNM